MGGVREVGGPSGRRLWPPGGGRLCRKVAMKRFLRWMRPVGARVLRFDSGFAAEGCGIAFGHACGVRVQRGWYRRFAAMGFMLWRSCIGPPSQPKLALSLPIKGPSFCRLTVVGGSAARGSENRTTGPAARWKCTPIPLRGLPPMGEVLATLSLEMLMSSKAERR